MDKPTVYLETSVISYLTARPSRDLIMAAHQQITSVWWRRMRSRTKCFVSQFVVDEAKRGDKSASAKRIEVVAKLDSLEIPSSIEDIAEKYFTALDIPERSRVDSLHLALAAWHKMDYLLSWNCKHIASARVQKIIRELNVELGIHTPIVCTPEELMEI